MKRTNLRATGLLAGLVLIPTSQLFAANSVIGLVSSKATATESGTTATVSLVVNRTGGTITDAVSVNYAVTPGSTNPATVTTDYTGTLTGTLTWAAGDATAKTIPAITIASDSIAEFDETITVTLSTLTGTNTLGISATTVTIADDDLTRAASALQVTGTNPSVRTLLSLPGGDTLAAITGTVANTGTTIAQGTGATVSHYNLVKITSTGAATAAAAGLFNAPITAMSRQSDGKILVLGSFDKVATVSGVGRSYLARLNADATLTFDTSFQPSPAPTSGPDKMAIDSAGNIYLAGNFTSYGGQTGYDNLVRLFPDGTLDRSFTRSPADGSDVNALLVQPDGKLLVIGDIDNLRGDGAPVRSIYRLNVDGTVDTDFTPPAFTGSLAFTSAALDSQGRIILNQFNPVNTLFRLLPTGVLDSTFTFKGVMNNRIHSIAVLPGDQLLVSGVFTQITTNGVVAPLPRLIRLNEDGTIHTPFNAVSTDLTGTGSFSIDNVLTKPNGQILLSGAFTKYTNVDANRLLVLQGAATTPAGFYIKPVGQTAGVGGSVTFSASATSGTYQWRRNGVNLTDGVVASVGTVSGATTSTLAITNLGTSSAGTTATGYDVVVTSGTTITSDRVALTLLTAPQITTQPVEASVSALADVTFSVGVRGPSTLTYVWKKDGVVVPLATSSVLNLTAVTALNAGVYTVEVTGGGSTVISSGALLTVDTSGVISTGALKPQNVAFTAITGRTYVAGDTVALNADASSGLTAITYAVTSGPATVSGSTLTITGAGNITVTATQAGGSGFAAATATRTFTVSKATQTITFNDLVDKNSTAPAFTVSATSTAGSATPITFEIPTEPSSPATISGSTITLGRGAGTVTVIARKAGDSNYRPAEPVTRTFKVTNNALLAQTITFAQPAPRVFGSAPAPVSFRTSATGIPTPTLTSSNTAVATVVGDVVTIVGAGSTVLTVSSPADAAGKYAAATPVTRTLVVSQKSQTITFNVPATYTLGNPALNLAAALPLSLSATTVVASTTVTVASTTGISVGMAVTGTGIPLGTTVATVVNSTSVTLSAAATTAGTRALVFATPASSGATSGLAITYTLKAGSPATLATSTLTPTGPGKITVTATQTGNTNYLAAAPVTRVITIATPVLTLSGLAPTYTGAPIPVTVTGQPIGFTPVVTYQLGSAAATTTAPTVPGTYKVVATLGAAVRKGTLIIKKKVLTVTASAVTTKVGTTIPTSGAAAAAFFPLTYSGFAAPGGVTETAAVLDTTAPGSLPVARASASATSNQGTYPITVSGGLDNCYSFTYVKGTLTLRGLGGTYEALINDTTTGLPIGQLSLTVLNNSFGYTGKLQLAGEPAIVQLRSGVAPNTSPLTSADGLTATGTITRSSSSTLAALSLSVTINSGVLTGTFSSTKDAVVQSGTITNGSITRSVSTGTPGVGAYTLVLNPPARHSTQSSDTRPIPEGAGHATATVSAAGLITINGKLPDGTTLTTSARMTDAGNFVLFVKPHGTRNGNYLSGYFPVTTHPTVSTLRRVDSTTLTWNKPLVASDSTYALSFGPLTTVASLEAWQAPVSGVTTLADRLRLVSGVLAIDFIGSLSTDQDLALATTTTRTLLADNSILAVAAASNPAVFTLNFPGSTLTTGAFTGSFKLIVPPATATSTINFSGVLRQAPVTGVNQPGLVGSGFYTIPGSNGATTGQIKFGITAGF